MIEPISSFASRFKANVSLDESLVVKEQNRYFLINENLKKLMAKDFYYAGVYLGKTKNGKFFPSFSLLAMIAARKANKVVVDAKSAWLFICGRDIFRRGIVKASDSEEKGASVLVLNKYGECLGFGTITRDLNKGGEKDVVVKNVSDVGDFLRRET